MNERGLRSKWFIIGILSLLFSFPVFLKAQNYNYQDSTKTDSTRTDSTRTDTVGYYNSNSSDNYTYALNNSSTYLQDSTMNDTSRTDTTRTDTLGYSNSKGNAYAYNINLNSGVFLQDSSMTDTSKTDTTKSDTLGYRHLEKDYAFNANINNNFSFKNECGSLIVNNLWRRFS